MKGLEILKGNYTVHYRKTKSAETQYFAKNALCASFSINWVLFKASSIQSLGFNYQANGLVLKATFETPLTSACKLITFHPVLFFSSQRWYKKALV